MRAFAASAFLPPVILFPLWALAAWHGTRGPAGAAAGLVLCIVPILCAVAAVPVLRGSVPPWGWRTKAVLALDLLLLAGVLAVRPLMNSRYKLRSEAETREALGSLRAAIASWERAHHGVPPERPSLMTPGLLPELPRLNLPGTGHPITREVRFPASNEPPDSGKWYYVNEPGHPSFGAVAIDCTHADSLGQRWSDY